VTAKLTGTDEVPLEMLAEWLDESFRAIAPKQVLAKLDGLGAKQATAPPKRAARGNKSTRRRTD